MAIKLLHTGDLHLDAPFLFLGEKGQIQRQQLLATLNKIVEIAIDENVDLFLISGDLFASNNPSCNTIDHVVDAFKKLEQANIPICLIPGCGDSFGHQSIYRLYDFKEACPNLTIFTDRLKQKAFDDLDLTVHGEAVIGKGSPDSPLRNLRPSHKTKFNIAMIHGTVNGIQKNPNEKDIFNLKEIKASKMDYIALGHHHIFTNYSQDSVRACYCGAPEMISPDQNNSAHVAIVTIQSSGDINIESKRVSQSHFKSITIPLDSINNIDEIITIIKSKAHRNVFLEVHLAGLCGFDLSLNVESLEKDLDSYFLRLKIIDESHPDLEEIQINELPSNTVMGQYVKMMMEELNKATGQEKDLAEKALKLGVNLLRGQKITDDHQRNSA